MEVDGGVWDGWLGKKLVGREDADGHVPTSHGRISKGPGLDQCSLALNRHEFFTRRLRSIPEMDLGGKGS